MVFMASRLKHPTVKRAVVLLSGGMDSAVALWWAKKKGFRCTALSFDYGQRHRRELKSAVNLAKLANVPVQTVRFGLPWSGSSLTNRRMGLPRRSLNKTVSSIPTTYVPGRNTIFLSFAMSLADEINAECIIIGANAIDYSGYPDCRGPYLNAFERVATLGSRLGTEKKRKMRIVAPLLKLTKGDIVRLAVQLKVPLSLTWSCYAGGKRPCGFCDSCRLREKGYHEAGLNNT
jgi:7-cyano-7-deazaguanine synthase